MDRNALTGAEKEKILAYQPPKKAGNGSAADQSAYVGDRGKTDEEREAIWKAGNIYDPGHSPSDIEWFKARRAETLEKLEADTAAYEESLRPKSEREKRDQEREEAMARSLEDPILQERYDLLKRRTAQDLISPDHMDRWEESAREGAEEQKAAILARARAMGLNASQMEALNQSLQETDATFERQIQKLRFENRESAKEEFENFTLALQTEGANQIHAQQSLALQAERDRSARSRTLWGSILGFVGGVAGGVAGYFATAGNPMGAVAGATGGAAALGALGRSV